MRAGRRGWFAFVLVGAAALGPGLPVGAATIAQARIVSFTFSPGMIQVDTGGKVVWTNADGARHTVTSDASGATSSFASGDIVKDGAYEHRFHSAGTFAYHCEHHPSMKGTVQVGPAPTTTTSSAPTTTSTAPPASTTVPPTTATTATTSLATTSSTASPSAAAGAPEGESILPSTTSTEPPSTTTSLRVSTTTTTSAPPRSTSTVSSMPPVVAGVDMAGDLPAPNQEAARSQAASWGEATGDERPEPAAAAAAPTPAGGFDPAVTILVALLVAVGAVGAWSLFQFRPGKH